MTNEAEQDLQACFDCTDWSVFEAAANDLDELTETVTSYISFCEDMCIPTRTYLTYNNDKPWFIAKLGQLRQAKEDAYRNGDRVLYKQAKYTLEKETRVVKRNSWSPSFHRSSTDHWSCAKSPHASNAPPSSPSQRNPKLQDLMTKDLLL